MTDSLFTEDADFMDGKTDVRQKKKPPHPRDEDWSKLFKLCEETFYPSGIADCQRARVVKLVDGLRQKGASVANFGARMDRYGHLFPNSVRTLAAMLSQWDTCEPVGRTRQPGMPSDEEQERERREADAHRLLCDEESAARNRAFQVVQLADPNVVKRIYEEWKADNPGLVRHAPLATNRLCVRDIADRLEARNA